jgi:hypothetical protein
MKIAPIVLASSLVLACTAPAPEPEEEEAQSTEDELVSQMIPVTYGGAILVDGVAYPVELSIAYPSAAVLPQIIRPEGGDCFTATGGALATTRLVIRGKNGAILVDHAMNASVHGHALDTARTPAQCAAASSPWWSMQATAERNGIFWQLGARRIQVGGIIGLNGNPGIRISGSATYRRRTAYEMTDLGPDSIWNARRGVLRPMLDRKMTLDVFLTPGVSQQVILTAP